MKNPFMFVVVVFLAWAGFSFPQGQKPGLKMVLKDSTLKTTLEEVVVESSKDSFKISPLIGTFYSDDPQKTLTLMPGVVSVIPLLAENTVDNLPSQFTGMYFGKDMLIPILGNKTIFQGANSIVNPEIFNLILNADSYPAFYGSLGGVKRMIPKEFKEGLSGKVSSDFTDRYAVFSGNGAFFGIDAKFRFSLRQVKVFHLISKVIPELKLLPEVIDIEMHSSLSHKKTSFEGYFLNSSQYQNFQGESSFGLTDINQNINHVILLGILKHRLEDVTLKFAHSYEKESQSSDLILLSNKVESEEYLKNLTMNVELSEKNDNYRMGFTFNSFNNVRLENGTGRNIYTLYFEKKFILGNFLLIPSSSLSLFNKRFGDSEVLQVSYFADRFEFNFSLGKYETFLFDNNSMFEKRIYPKEYEKQDIGKHISLGGRVDTKSNLASFVDVSFFLKYLNAEFQREGYVKGSSKGIRALLRSDLLNSLFTGYLASSEMNGHEISGTISYDFNLTSSIPLFEELAFNFQIGIRDGIWSKNHSSGVYSRFENSYFLNLGFSSNFKFPGVEFEASVAGFNLLGKSAELVRYYSEEELVSKKAPIWGNLLLSIQF